MMESVVVHPMFAPPITEAKVEEESPLSRSSSSSSLGRAVPCLPDMEKSQYVPSKKKAVPGYFKYASTETYERASGRRHGHDPTHESPRAGVSTRQQSSSRVGRRWIGTDRVNSPELPPRKVRLSTQLYDDHDPLLSGGTVSSVLRTYQEPQGLKKVEVQQAEEDLSYLKPSKRIVPQRSHEENNIARPIDTGGIFPENAKPARRVQRQVRDGGLKDALHYSFAGRLHSDSCFADKQRERENYEKALLTERNQQETTNRSMYGQLKQSSYSGCAAISDPIYDTAL